MFVNITTYEALQATNIRGATSGTSGVGIISAMHLKG